MGLFQLVTFASSRVAKLGRSIGDSVIGTSVTDSDIDKDSEVYAAHGIVSRPSKKTRGIRIRIGNIGIVIGAYTYGVAPPVNPGACKLYSTDAAGTEQGSHLINDDGIHTINGGTNLAAREGDTTQLTLVASDVNALAAALLASGAFTPSGSPPAAVAPITFTGGEITSGTNEVLLP